MGQKDIAQKILEAHNDVFADIVNVLLFDGDEVIKAKELVDQSARSAYKIDGRYRELERDVAKRWKSESIRVACIGIENQTKQDKDMPLRVLAYDGAEYRSQLNADNPSNNRYPIVTLVLYFDYKKKWDKPLNLLDCLNIPERFRPYVSDYKINVFDIAYLTEEQVKRFKSDFRFVADYFVQMRKTGDYKGSHEEIKYVQETLSLMAAVTCDNRFEDMLLEEPSSGGKEIKTMCEALDRVEARGIAKGRASGLADGRLNEKIATAKSLRDMGMDIPFISKALKISEESVISLLSMQTV